MYNKLYPLSFSVALLTATLMSPNATAKDDNDLDLFQIDLSLDAMQSGSLDLEDDQLLALELKYFFHERSFLQSNIHTPFIAAGLRTDLDNEGSNINLYSFDLGAQSNLGTLWGQRTYVEYSLGAIYSQTDYSFELLDRNSNHTFNEFTYKASIGLGVDLHDDVSTKLALSRFGDSTMIGLSIGYKF